MATLTIDLMGETGLLPTFPAASAGGDVFANDNTERTFVWVKNNSGVSVVTATAQKTIAAIRIPRIG